MNYVVILHEGEWSDYSFYILYVGQDKSQAELVKTTIEDKLNKCHRKFNDPYNVVIEEYSDDDNTTLFLQECKRWDDMIEN